MPVEVFTIEGPQERLLDKSSAITPEMVAEEIRRAHEEIIEGKGKIIGQYVLDWVLLNEGIRNKSNILYIVAEMPEPTQS
jgi:hypothetical protein